MAKHDAALFDLPVPAECETRHSWMRGGNHYYFYTMYGDPRRMTAPKVKGFEIVKLWDEDRNVAEVASKVLCGKPAVCDTVEEVSDDVDLVLIADCNGDGCDHLQLASPGLKKGVSQLHKMHSRLSSHVADSPVEILTIADSQLRSP